MSMRTAVCVLGFHRSGTSMTTRALNLLGVELGGDLLEPNEDNPRGYWEPDWMVALNDAVLGEVGATYLEPPAEDARWGDLAELRDRAAALLDEHLSGPALFGFKDPRLCLTWPFWKDLVAARTDAIKYVVCVRSPLETAASMIRRDLYPGVTYEGWGDLWLEYTGRALAETDGESRLIVHYEDLLLGGPREARRLAEFLGVAWPEDERAAELEASIDASLRHHATSLAAVSADDRLPASARAAYTSIRAAAGAQGELAEALERSAVALWRARRCETGRDALLAVHRQAATEAIGELQLSERREEFALAELARLRPA